MAPIPAGGHVPQMSESRRTPLFFRLAAEFLTIVLGVLVALGVDGWRETRADVRREMEYYHSMVEDLERDISEYESSRDFMALSIQAADQVLATINGSSPSGPYPTLDDAVHYASWVNYPSWSSGTLGELVNSGAIRLIRNREVKRAVLAYYDEINEWKPRLQGPEFSAFIAYRRMTMGWTPLDRLTWDIERASTLSETPVPPDPELVARLRGNEVLLGLTQEMLWQWDGLDSFMEGFNDQATALKELLQQELAAR